MDDIKALETCNKIKTFIPEEDIYINEPMSKHTTFKIGGNADIFIKLRSIEQIEKIVKLSREINEPLKIIGNGSNILVKDNGIRGIVAKVCTNSYEFIDDETIKVDAGLLNSKVAQILLNKQLSGFEFAAGIPGGGDGDALPGGEGRGEPGWTFRQTLRLASVHRGRGDDRPAAGE